MTRTKITFSYTESQDFEEPLQITMEVPVRTIDEMCEYFQRFLTVSGWLFDEGERITVVRNKTESSKDTDPSNYPGCCGDELTFSNGKPFIYDFDTQTQVPWDFGGDNNIPCDFGDNNNPFFGGVSPYSGVRGGMAEDIIKL